MLVQKNSLYIEYTEKLTGRRESEDTQKTKRKAQNIVECNRSYDIRLYDNQSFGNICMINRLYNIRSYNDKSYREIRMINRSNDNRLYDD